MSPGLPHRSVPQPDVDRMVEMPGHPDGIVTHAPLDPDAAVLVVGTRAPGSAAHVRELLEGSVAVHLAHHQHRPVLTVPMSVVDWKETRAPWQ